MMTEEQTDLQKLKKQIETVMKSDDRLWDEEGILDQIKLIEFAVAYDEKIIDLLYSDESLRQKFFLKIKDVFIFKTNNFQFFMEENKVDNSFTAYRNRIGLTDGKKFIKDTNDIVLNFPYKDCVLEGGQSTEEGLDEYYEYQEEKKKKVKGQNVVEPKGYKKKSATRQEIFYNETLAHDEIDRLLDTKAFVNWKRYDKDGEHKVGKMKRHADGTICENMIIKGNNLLALHSIKKQFTDKIKLIYIDPPYNTGNDSFNYNDKFTHSAWLTFIKNRLEVAHDLLKENGVIFISINHIELAYISIILDELFGRDNKLPIITLKAATTASYRAINDCPVNVTEYVLAYSKNKNFKPNKVYKKTGYYEVYSHFIENFNERPEDWKLVRLSEVIYKNNNCENSKGFKEKFGKYWKIIRAKAIEEFAFANKDKIVSLSTLQKPSEAIKEVINLSKERKGKVFVKERDDSQNIYCYNGRTLAFFGKKFREIDGENVPSEVLTNLWSDVSFLGIASEGKVTLRNGKKPENLIKTIIELCTNKDDIILDYHVGSGTTAAVAHKMGRQYIGVEQLCYKENDSIIRLKNVMEGEKYGISKIVNWKGGGEFIYCELAKWNEQAKEEIQACKNLKQLEALLNDLCNKYFLHYNVKIKEFKEKIIKEKEFRSLSLESQKEMFSIMLDNNQLCVHYSEMEDSRFKISASDQLLTKEFYENG